jgi:hypothetical protein
MSLPPLYKYLDVDGAKLTLRHGTFKHSKPSDFNDTADLTIESLFPESEESVLTTIKNNFHNIILENIDTPPTCLNLQLRENIALLQTIYKQNPNSVKILKDSAEKEAISEVYDLDHMNAFAQASIKDINNFLQGYRVLCVSEKIDSEIMWDTYAQYHQGIALRIVPNMEKDSKFTRFQKVSYRAERPPLYDDALSFLKGSLFGDQEKDKRTLLEKIIYTKTLKWEHEKEYRLAIPIIDGKNWNLMPYHPEEITELYLGAEIRDNAKRDIVGLAKSLNPNISIFQSRIHADKNISFYKT